MGFSRETVESATHHALSELDLILVSSFNPSPMYDIIQYLSSLSSRRVISRMSTGTDVGGKKPNSVMTRVTYLMGVRS